MKQGFPVKTETSNQSQSLVPDTPTLVRKDPITDLAQTEPDRHAYPVWKAYGTVPPRETTQCLLHNWLLHCLLFCLVNVSDVIQLEDGVADRVEWITMIQDETSQL